MRKVLCLIVLACASPAFAQMTTADAEKAMKDREAQKTAAATRPSGLTVAQVQALRDEITTLEAENAKLKAEVAAIPQSPSISTDKPDKNGIIHRKVALGMTVDDVNKLTGVEGVFVSQDASGTQYKWIIPRRFKSRKEQPTPRTDLVTTNSMVRLRAASFPRFPAALSQAARTMGDEAMQGEMEIQRRHHSN